MTEFGPELAKLVEDMMETMEDVDGAGLAAPQVGVGKRVFTYQVEGVRGHLINPVLETGDEFQDEGAEGCLSIPGLGFRVRRRRWTRATGVDVDGNPLWWRVRDMLARCLQHETDHLDGMLYVDRLDGEDRKSCAACHPQCQLRIRDGTDDGEAGPDGRFQFCRRQLWRELHEGPVCRDSCRRRAVVGGAVGRRVRRRRRADPPGCRRRTQTRADAVARRRGAPRNWALRSSGPPMWTPRSATAIAAAAPDVAAIVAYGGADPAVGPGSSAPRLGQPALFPAACLAWGRARAARGDRTATTSPAPSRSSWRTGWIRARSSGP